MEGSTVEPSVATYVVRLGATIFFVLANGFFAAAEFALVKVRASRLEARAHGGSRAARMAHHIVTHLDHYLSSCQLGITLTSLILGWLAEPAIAQLLLEGARILGVEAMVSPAVSHVVALGLALTVITVLHMTVGEQAPKIWAIRRADEASLLIAYPLWLFSVLFRPFIMFINAVSNRLLRLAGISPNEKEPSHDVDEIRGILSLSSKAGHLSTRQVALAENVLDLIRLEVRHILVPRVDVVVLSTEKPVEENLRIVRESGHTRFPLCKNHLDEVIGILHVKDLIPVLAQGSRPHLQKLVRQPLYVAETQSLPRFIGLLRRSRSHTAVVLDEYGSVLGLAFLEDALEHVVGTIQDEFDEDRPKPYREGEVAWVPGSLAIPEAVEWLGLPELDESTIDTIGGYFVAQLNRLPKGGDQLDMGPYRVTVTELSRHRILWLRFEPPETNG